MHILIASDHAGYDLKETLKSWLEANGHTFDDMGPSNADSMDYPDTAHPLAKRVNMAPDSYKGVLICGSANGMAITANKYPNVRAAIAWAPELAKLARSHNNANVLALPARFMTAEAATESLQAFLTTDFEGGRHTTRVNKIKAAAK